MGRVFVCVRIVSQKPGANICPWTNTISKTWGKYSSMDEYLLETLGEYSSMDEYFLENMGQIFVRGRIVSLGNVGRILVFVRGRVLFRKHGRIFVRGRIVLENVGRIFVRGRMLPLSHTTLTVYYKENSTAVTISFFRVPGPRLRGKKTKVPGTQYQYQLYLVQKACIKQKENAKKFAQCETAGDRQF